MLYMKCSVKYTNPTKTDIHNGMVSIPSLESVCWLETTLYYTDKQNNVEKYEILVPTYLQNVKKKKLQAVM